MAMENREKLGIFLLDFPNLRFKASPLCCHVDETPGKSSCLSRLNLLFSRFHRDHSTWKNSEKPSKDFPPSPQRYATRHDYEFSSTFPRQLFLISQTSRLPLFKDVERFRRDFLEQSQDTQRDNRSLPSTNLHVFPNFSIEHFHPLQGQSILWIFFSTQHSRIAEN
jgi:hypothetical protein